VFRYYSTSGPLNYKWLSMPEWIILATALFIILNGLLVCLGWWFEIPILVQLSPDDAPTHFNTGLGLILLGFGELGLVLQRQYLVTYMAAATIVLAVVETAAAGIALIALFGYVVQLKSAYGWTGSVGMSNRTWAGFLLIIIARITAIWRSDIVDQPRLPFKVKCRSA
jgi:hypothetical protein